MRDKNDDHVSGGLMPAADPIDLQKQGMAVIPRHILDDLRNPAAAMRIDPERPAKVYRAGSCFSCGYLPEHPSPPPKFCSECGARFIPVEPQNASDKEEKS